MAITIHDKATYGLNLSPTEILKYNNNCNFRFNLPILEAFQNKPRILRCKKGQNISS